MKQRLDILRTSTSKSFNEFLDRSTKPLRVAWYPSAGNDFRPLLYLNSSYTITRPVHEPEPEHPDIFIFSDAADDFHSLPYQNSYSDLNYDGPLLIQSKERWAFPARTIINAENVEQLALPNIPNLKIGHFGPKQRTRAYFFYANVESDKLGSFKVPVIYVYAENESFCAKWLLLNQIQISHIISVRYGGGLSGGKASGLWLKNIFSRLSCESYISDNFHNGAELEGDSIAMRRYHNLNPTSDERGFQLREYRRIPTGSWHADNVVFYRVDYSG